MMWLLSLPVCREHVLPPRHLPLRNFVQLLGRGRVYRPGNPTHLHRQDLRCIESLHDQGWGWSLPHRTEDRECCVGSHTVGVHQGMGSVVEALVC